MDGRIAHLHHSMRLPGADGTLSWVEIRGGLREVTTEVVMTDAYADAGDLIAQLSAASASLTEVNVIATADVDLTFVGHPQSVGDPPLNEVTLSVVGLRPLTAHEEALVVADLDRRDAELERDRPSLNRRYVYEPPHFRLGTPRR